MEYIDPLMEISIQTWLLYAFTGIIIFANVYGAEIMRYIQKKELEEKWKEQANKFRKK